MNAGRIAAALFAVLVVASTTVLVVSQNVRDRLVVDQVEIGNALDARGGRAVRIRFRLTQDEESGTVEIVHRGDVVETLAEGVPLGDYEIHRFQWRGSPDLDPGTYRVRLKLHSLGREVVLPEEIDVRNNPDG